ncbi:transmembrane protein 26 [Diorhabda sublineata]|uniref:transmembrane protein 26 n=1 Tax=Diorhabda sublineata TaxID=1163346 RepID=UPI0024E09571|nr:transmembrane protein 26 [Diorhabda sublineata]
MGKYRVVRAIFIRLVFVVHSLLAIAQLVYMKNDRRWWYLCCPLFFMILETVVTMTLRKNLEWSWFCPSVFLYLASVVPAIWLLELDKVERRMKALEELPMNLTTGAQLTDISNLIGIGVDIKLPDISLSTETWITLIEQFLMLILIIGRWMLPKGDLTRDQLSQLLLVYIGTAADILEFFDSFKDDKIASEPVLVLLTLAIWSWSLMQFTVVLTATKARKSRLATTSSTIQKSDNCCTIDVCSILLNITLQDAPYLAFRLLLICHYKIITYMNIFFTCKNTLVILLQIYRLYVVYTENNKEKPDDVELASTVSIISNLSRSDLTFEPKRRRRPPRSQQASIRSQSTVKSHKSRSSKKSIDTGDSSDSDGSRISSTRRERKSNTRKDTGYSTASSQTSTRNSGHLPPSKPTLDNVDRETRRMMKQKLKRSDRDTRGRRKLEDVFSEESDAANLEEPTLKKNKPKKNQSRESKNDKNSTFTTSDQSSD